MRHLLIIFLLLAILKDSRGTDLLIIGRDTINLMTFPLESLNFKFRPFNKSRIETSLSNTYPGYQAIWKIIDGYFVLSKIISTNGQETEDVHDLFVANGLTVERIADCFRVKWISITFYPMTAETTYNNPRFFAGSYDAEIRANAVLRVENGKVTINNL